MINEENIKTLLLKEAKIFVDKQIGEATDILEKEKNKKDAANHLTNIFNALTGYRKALIHLSDIVSCDKAIRVIVDGEQAVHQKLVDLSSQEEELVVEENEIYLLEEINNFVYNQLMEANSIVEKGYRKNVLAHLTDICGSIIKCQNTLEELSSFVSCDKAITIADKGKEKIFQMIREEQKKIYQNNS